MGDESSRIIEQVWQHPVELPTLAGSQVRRPGGHPAGEQRGLISCPETLARDGQAGRLFRARSVEINLGFPIGESLKTSWASAPRLKPGLLLLLKVGTVHPLMAGDPYIDGRQTPRRAALLGSTGSGKSFTVASILEQSAQLPTRT